MEVKTDLKMASIFERFLIDFESFWERFGIDFGANLAPCWRLFGCLGVLRGSCGYKYVSWRRLGPTCNQVGTKIDPKTIPKSIQNGLKIDAVLGSVLSSIFEGVLGPKNI